MLGEGDAERRRVVSDRFLVIDVESVGLHGEGLAVGWVVIERQGRRTLADGISVATEIYRGWGVPDWVRENVIPNLPPPTHPDAASLRADFWKLWRHWQARNAVLAADVPWPVEARFLAACVDDDRETREFQGPYPLLDIASVRLARGLDPLASEARWRSELPEHNPLADARQSARLLLDALDGGAS